MGTMCAPASDIDPTRRAPAIWQRFCRTSGAVSGVGCETGTRNKRQTLASMRAGAPVNGNHPRMPALSRSEGLADAVMRNAEAQHGTLHPGAY